MQSGRVADFSSKNELNKIRLCCRDPIPLAGHSFISLLFGSMKRRPHLLLPVGSLLALPGCSCIQEIGGAYFPAWLLSILIGWFLAAIVRLILIRVGIDGWIRPRSIGYPALLVFFTLLIYLIFFTH
jgi:hypothetical protein